MSRSIDLPLGNYPNGTRSTSWRAISDAITKASVEIARCTTADPTIWPNASTEVDLTIDFSMDGGATIALSATSGACPGGIAIGLHGVEAPATRIGLSPLPVGSGRAIRITATVRGGPIRTSGTVELT